MWTIDKQFHFEYGHRVWSQQLEAEFCESGNTQCKCRFMHGHSGKVHLYLESDVLKSGMVTDFRHTGFVKNFLDDNIDHKFVLDVNDPWFISIINAYPITEPINDEKVGWLHGMQPVFPLNTSDATTLSVIPVYMPETDVLTGYKVDTSAVQGPEAEFFGGFFLVNFLPTSENLCKWLFDAVSSKVEKLGVRVSRVDWWETVKSRSSYTGQR